LVTESYEQFAENLQKEIEADTGIRFGIVEKFHSAAIPITDTRQDCAARCGRQSGASSGLTKDAGLVDAGIKFRTLKKALKDGNATLPEQFGRTRSRDKGSPAQTSLVD
jgi:type III restriction enzyme